MADVRLITHYITAGISDGVHVTGNYIRVIADGTAVRSEVWTTAGGVIPEDGTLVATPSGGPDIDGEITVASSSFFNAQYCDGDDLVYYTIQNTWPYAASHVSTDHPSCAMVVCDLNIDSFSTTNETGVGNEDGTITPVASSSNGTVKYSLDPDFDYDTEGTTGSITGLGTGNYVVYAKDAGGCQDQINVFVGIDYVYGPRWRMEYDCVKPNGYSSRVDIEERDYSGSISEICGGKKPFELEYIPADDSQFVPSVANIEVLVETDGQFDDIRTGYDRQFLVKKYKDAGSGFVIEWVGYISQEFYSVPYIFEPYYLTLKALDGLGDLKEKLYVALSGEEYFGDASIIKVVAECLKKLPYQLNIRSCVNIFEENMDTDPEDDPLAQTYTKTENYRTYKCGAVITDLIKPFTKAELFQSYGYWWIRTREQSVYTSLAYREFDTDGDYSSNSTITARKNAGFPSTSSRFIWTDRSQILGQTRNYGKFQIVHNLDKDNNMIDSGGFELSDIDSGTEFFRGWQIFPAQTNVSSGYEYADNADSKGAFFFQWGADTSDQANNILQTKLLPITFTGNPFESKGTNFKLKFQVYVSPSYPVDYVWFGWRLRFTDTDTGDFWDWYRPASTLSPFPDVNEERINDLYISSFGSWQTFEFYNFRPPGGVSVVNFTIQVSFYFHNHRGRDYSGMSALIAEDTAGVFEEGKRFLVAHDFGDGENTYVMELQNNRDAETYPTSADVVEPGDFHTISNPYKWIKIGEYNPDGTVPLLDRVMIDNVQLSIYDVEPILDGPGIALVDPPDTVLYEQEVSTQNESILTDEVKNGDAPDIQGYDYIYNGFFKLTDGTKTYTWARSGVTEERRLLDIYLGYLSAQGSRSLRVLSGAGIADIQLGYINSLNDTIDDTRYRFVRFVFDDKQGSFDVEIEEVLTGADGESPPEDVGILLAEDSTPITTEDGSFIFVE